MPEPITGRLIMLALLVAPSLATAQPGQGNQSNWRIGAAFGYGERTNPLVQSEDIPIVVDLDIAWFGERWFFDNGDAGLTFADDGAVTASLVGRFNSERVFFSRTDTRYVTLSVTGSPFAEPVAFRPPDRDYAIELGVEMLTDGRWGALQLSAFQDVSGTHEGFELYADYSFGWRNRRIYIEPSLGASYKSADLNNYYWGVTQAEAGNVVLPYEAGSGINWHARLVFGFQVNLQWAVTLVAEYERLNDAAAMSPIVDEHDVKGFFAGMAWRF